VGKLKKYKLKTHKGIAKRFRVTGTGKVVRTYMGKSHLRRHKPSRAKKQFKKLIGLASARQARNIKRLAPYLGRHRQNARS